MDAIAGLAFGIVVIDVIRRMGVDNDDAIAEDVLSSGLLTGALMALIYVVSIVVGAQSRGCLLYTSAAAVHHLGEARGAADGSVAECPQRRALQDIAAVDDEGVAVLAELAGTFEQADVCLLYTST